MTLPLFDARGLSCPEPLVMTKKAMDKYAGPFQVLVDNKGALQNVSRFAQDHKYLVKAEEAGADFVLTITKP